MFIYITTGTTKPSLYTRAERLLNTMFIIFFQFSLLFFVGYSVALYAVVFSICCISNLDFYYQHICGDYIVLWVAAFHFLCGISLRDLIVHKKPLFESNFQPFFFFFSSRFLFANRVFHVRIYFCVQGILLFNGSSILLM